MSVYPGGHTGFLAVALATHALVGYALGTVLFARPRAGLVGGVVADVDLLVPASAGHPWVHRSLTHSALALGVAVAVGATWDRKTAGAVAAGYLSHLCIDATTPMGIPLLWPLAPDYLGVNLPLSGHGLPATALLWVCSLGLLAWDRRELVRRATGYADSH